MDLARALRGLSVEEQSPGSLGKFTVSNVASVPPPVDIFVPNHLCKENNGDMRNKARIRIV